ncbi:hypothetical protein ISN45_At02g023910 [Arabidopsis thaliana x Arabidopsis arenosa]|uniref:Uncharacterized protein n=4 Tax=Arabidopsis TaxID=3701 RepID=B3H608_ARATH|nr:uncharacterized protein AT2G29679 [Arabidopsis thaliana]AEC08291.1 hypothetical protein AT2G29679 [Arabidopsis thaliana]KAG7637902.1 hypothetical protein ISN45_At02g023910 [Arabidopsis thaliana x Arabidopsis arenosa]KAG7642510.1 hypothetical protein ISN44_As02g024200 [Arabidopsis suecica]CAA0373301.1 unnamed protein product [Arabidopsis thaliana]|eukprot:NP_001118413.1 hypothetical protein AT2G29679 [Arabidopsis thaliana]
MEQNFFAARFSSATVLNHRLRGNFIGPHYGLNNLTPIKAL